MKPSELIDQGLVRIPDESKWGQGHFYLGGKYCIRGAIMCGSHPLVEAAAVEAIWAVIVAQFPTSGHDGRISTFNDAPERIYPEVRMVMEKARADLQERGN